MLRNEVLLMLLALGLYVYDSLVLLEGNAAVLTRTRGKWVAFFGEHKWRLRQKEPFLPNLLMPHRPFLVLSWNFEHEVEVEAEATGESNAVEPAPELRRPAPYVLGAAMSMFVLLPLALFVLSNPGLVLFSILLIYANILIGLFSLSRVRKRIGLSGKRYWQIASESILCAPLALNMIKKADHATRGSSAGHLDFVSVAKSVLTPENLAQAYAQCVRRLDEQIDYESEQSARMERLVARRIVLSPGGIQEDTP